MKSRMLSYTFIAISLGACQFLHAQSYVGATVGRSDISPDTDVRSNEFLDLGFDSASTSTRNHDTAYRAYAGYWFERHFGVELGYVDLGKFEFRSDVMPAGALVGETRIRGEELNLVGRLPVGERWAIFVRGGVLRARTVTDYAGSGSVVVLDGAEHQSKRTASPAYAIGATYDFSPKLSLRAEWARYTRLGDDLTGGRTDANFVSVGAMYQFGQ